MVEVQPDDWVLPNRKGFLDWTYNTFHPHVYPEDRRGLYMHQRFVRDFLQYKSPYRGLMLFHQLGTGKTGSSIAAAEGFIKSNKKVVIMTPASLAENYKEEILKHSSSGKPTRKIWAVVNLKVRGTKAALDISDSFANKMGAEIMIPMTMLDSVKEEAILEKDVPWTALNDNQQDGARAVLRYYIEKRYMFINYNGLSERSAALREFTAALDTYKPLVIIDEAHNFISRVVNGSKTSRRIYQDLMRAGTAKVILLTGTPVINHPFELCIGLNLVRGPIRVITYKVLADGTLPMDVDEVYAALGIDPATNGATGHLIDEIIINRRERQIQVALQRYNNKKEDVEKIHELLVQNFGVGKPRFQETYALPMTKEEFAETFLDETDIENPRIKNMDVFARRIIGIVSYVKTVGEATFPTVLRQPTEPIYMSKYQFDKYREVRVTERDMQNTGGGGIFGKQSSVYRAFSRMACNFVFPEEIPRLFPKDIRKAKKEAMLEISDDAGNPIIGDVVDDGADKADGVGTGSISSDLKNEYNNKTAETVERLRKHADLYLTQKDLLDKYSPKMAKIMEDIKESVGKVLLYSQFRTVEGLGIIKVIMEYNGYIELNVEMKDGEWSIVNADEVLKPEYNGKRFIVFGGDKDHNRILLELYNRTTQTTKLPSSLRSVSEINLQGDFIKLIMITQSGAEGISLTCVRRVLIMEPFWNMVRIDQVIGRAVRARSHDALPDEQRNVTVSIYTTVFTREQAKDLTIKNKDSSMTTDTHILSIAEKKDEIIQVFLNQLKIAAVDCRSLAKTNNIRDNDMSCYSFPIPWKANDLAYHAYLSQDLAQGKKNARLVRQNKIQGKVVVRKGTSKKYVQVPEYPNKLFDYDAYVKAGVLVEAKTLED
jgi:superfamily II DNA or RNA helicase